MKTIYALVQTSEFSSANTSWSTSGSNLWQLQSVNVSDDILFFLKMKIKKNVQTSDLDLSGYSSLRFLIRKDRNVTSSLYAFQDQFNQQSDPDEDLSLGQVSFSVNIGNIEYSIVGIDTGTDTIAVSGDWSNQFSSGEELNIKNSTGNDGTYTIDTVSFDSANNETDISVTTSITDATVDGEIVHNKAKIDLESTNTLDCFIEVNGIDANGNHSTLTQLPLKIVDQLDDGTVGSANSEAPSFLSVTELNNNYVRKDERNVTDLGDIGSSQTLDFDGTHLQEGEVSQDASISYNNVATTVQKTLNVYLENTAGSEVVITLPTTSYIEYDEIIDSNTIAFDDGDVIKLELQSFNSKVFVVVRRFNTISELESSSSS